MTSIRPGSPPPPSDPDPGASGPSARGPHDDSLAAAAAAAAGTGKRRYVRQIFSEIAPRYDLLNHLLSANVDRGWRRAAIAELDWRREPDGVFLDLCAGTMDIAVQLADTRGFAGRVMAADFAEPMLRAGEGKRAGRAIHPVVADALELPVADGSLSGAIVGFGVRNLADLDAGLREVHRALAPGARFVILELSRPRSAVVRAGYHLYFHRLLPLVGRLVSGHRSAYSYLPDSVAHFPTGDALAGRLRGAGFAAVHWRPVTFGIAAIHTAMKGSGA